VSPIATITQLTQLRDIIAVYPQTHMQQTNWYMLCPNAESVNLKHGVRIITTVFERIKEKEQKLNILSDSINKRKVYNRKRESEGKVLPVNTMKTYRGSEGITPLILNLCTRWRKRTMTKQLYRAESLFRS
jgi:hypothetical protein